MRLQLLAVAAFALLALPAQAMAAPADFDTPGTTGLNPPSDPSTAPFVTGSAQEGGTLTGDRGIWADDPDPESEWLRCNVAARTCETTGDTDLTYRPTAADVGLTIKLRVVATRVVVVPTGTRTRDAVSNPIAAAPAGPAAPKSVSAPRITGSPREGQTLGVDRGQWTGTEPIAYSYSWSRCAKGSLCRVVSNTAAYRVKAADVGRNLLLLITARNVGGASAVSVATDIVAARAAGLKRLSPFPTLLIDGRVAGAVTSISTLRLRRVPGGSTINASCGGRGCPFRKSTVKVRKGKSRTVGLRRLQRRMRAGTTVVITVRKGNTLGKYIRLRFRRGTAPGRVDRCVAPKSAKPVKCP